jgi:GT2 family glycosyltransferase
VTLPDTGVGTDLARSGTPLGETVSVVICAYTMRRWDDIVDAVRSVTSQLSTGDEVVVVIDHNDELFARATETFGGLDRVTVVPNAGKRGLSGGRNTGIMTGGGSIVAFLDDDATADPGWLAAMVEAFAEPDVLGVGTAPVPRWPGGERPAWFPPELDWIVGCAYRGMPETDADVRNVIGAAMAFRREVFDLAGVFSDQVGRVGTLPTGCEETELCIRLRQARPGARIRYLPDAKVRHRVTEDRVQPRYAIRRSLGEGVSKAMVSRLVGPDDALETERRYVQHVLPRAVLRELGRLGRGRLAGAGAATVIVASVAAAGIGYLRGRLSLAAAGAGVEYAGGEPGGSAARPGGATRFRPVLVADVDVADLRNGRLPLPLRRHDGETYGGAELLVRTGRTPLALLQVPWDRPEHITAVEARLGELSAVDVPPPPAAPDAHAPPVSVVMPTKGRPELAMRAIRSVLATQWPNLEVLLVDDGHDDTSSATALRAFAAENGVRYLESERPGASAARNRGLAAARGEFVAFSDDDVVVDRYWIESLVAAFDSPDVACVTGLVLARRLDTPAQVWFEQYGGFAKGLEPKRFDLDPRHDRPSLYPFAAGAFGSGNNAAFRRDALLALGGYDENLGPGTSCRSGEDLELFLRVIRSGRVLAYAPDALVRHDHREHADELLRQLHSYGRGITAMLCAQTARDKSTVWEVARRLPRAAHFLFAPTSAKNNARSASFPRRFALAELAGIAVGPGAYAARRLRVAVARAR